MLDERRRMRRLRQDLERVRLLCELIRKREQRKRDLVTATMNIKYLELNPFAYFLRKVMDLLQEQDHQDIFGEPVDPAEVPDYLGKCSALVFQGPVVLMRVPYPRRSRIAAGPTLNFDD